MKTIEQASKDVSWLGCTEFKKGVEFAQQWIKIDDELPNNNEIVITIRKKLNGKTYYHLNSINDGKWNIAIPDTSDVTHWRYIDLK